jgi:hypothetical protein
MRAVSTLRSSMLVVGTQKTRVRDLYCNIAAHSLEQLVLAHCTVSHRDGHCSFDHVHGMALED